jgi:hypothetical protein
MISGNYLDSFLLAKNSEITNMKLKPEEERGNEFSDIEFPGSVLDPAKPVYWLKRSGCTFHASGHAPTPLP